MHYAIDDKFFTTTPQIKTLDLPFGKGVLTDSWREKKPLGKQVSVNLEKRNTYTASPA